MPAYARCEIVDEINVGVYHCVSRCVRRAFLCGQDPLTGQNYDHRKDWIQAGMEDLAGIFAVEVLGFSVMSNHIHVVLRNRPDLAAGWSDEVVARRWWRLHPPRRNEDGSPAEPNGQEIAALLADVDAIAEHRRRLSSISWWMRSLCEPIARRANREDRCTGRFWEGRFKSQALLDEAAILTCSIYVDLNPIRARQAETPEMSKFTAAFERIAARQAAAANAASVAASAAAPVDSQPAGSEPAGSAACDAWLSPVPDADMGPAQPELSPPSARASNRGFLPMSLDDYLALLDWTGRQVRLDKRGAIPAELLPILERLAINAETWLDTITSFGRWFHRAVGRAASMAARAGRSGKQWFQGTSFCRQAFD